MINNEEDEARRIKEVYNKRDALTGDRYAFYQADLRLQMSSREWAICHFLKSAFDGDLQNIKILDVGCGMGDWLRTLLNWGATAENLTGTEFLDDRLEHARQISAKGINWHLGGLESLPADEKFHLVSAFTVFTSILDQNVRENLAREIWDRVMPGGWVLIFDFRYNHPSNKDVRKLTRDEMYDWWPSSVRAYRTLWLVPPLARRIAAMGYLTPQILSVLFPFLRSHFIYTVQKPVSNNE